MGCTSVQKVQGVYDVVTWVIADSWSHTLLKDSDTYVLTGVML